MKTALALTDITKSYDDRLIVDKLSLAVSNGSIIALLGPNGAGKTTTMKMCAGLIPPDGGSISIAGYDLISSQKKARNAMTFLPENVALYQELTGRENLLHLLEIGTGVKLQAKDLNAALVAAGLPEEAIERRTSTYSKGMRQKVGIALALAKKANLLLLDEPSSGLDPHSAAEFNQSLKELSQLGVGILMATHDIWRAKEVADTIAIMVKGKIVLELDPKKLSAEEIERRFFLQME